jgi:adenosine deaminase
MKRLAQDRIPLTVCPLSNLKLCVFPNLEQHNLRELLDAGLMSPRSTPTTRPTSAAT